DDIESVTVLKGAAASALYGSQGANGVILITTRRASRGLGITVNSGVSLGKVDKSTFATYQKEYGAGYGAFYEDPTGFFLFRDIDGNGTDDLVAPILEDASYGGRFNPSLMVYQWDAFDPSSPNFGKARPWVGAANDPSDFFESPLSTNNSVFIDGGSDRGTFKLGYTRTTDRGFMPNSKLGKNLINFGGTYNIIPQLTAGASVNFTNQEGKGRYGTGYDGASARNLMTNFRQWWQTNVDIKEQRDAYFRNKQNITWNWKDPDNLIPNFWDNPYWTRYENFQNDERNRVFGNVSLNYKPLPWLNILGRAALDSYDELQEERIAVGSVANSEYERFNRSYRESNLDLIANMDRDLSADINFKALLGTNIRRQQTQSIRAETNGGLIVPRVYSLGNSINTPNAPVEFDGTREVQGIFAGATFTWRDMLTLDATVRRDKSSTLPEENNSYYYPSVSAGFTFSRLLPGATWLSYGKVRANYAQVGNDAPLFSVNDTYTGIAPINGNPQTSVAGTKNNPDLVPEQTKSAELGLEMSFLRNRLGFDFSYYNAKTVDQIVPVVVSTATGYNSKFLNAGTIENRGLELALYGTPVQTQDFSWTVNVNWSKNENEVVELFEGAENLVLGNFQGGVSINATVGQPYGTIRGSDYVYTNGQRTVNQANGRYLISPTSNTVIGNVNPDWIGGINNSLRYKNLSLSFLIDTRQGGNVFSLDMFYGLGTGLYPETVANNDLGNPSRNPVSQGGGIILPGVAPDGKPNQVRRANSEGTLGYRQPAGGFVYDASYIKLREAVIGYALPRTITDRLKPFKGIDLSLVGRNLWIIDKELPYADPEEMLGAGNLQGYQSGAYPTMRTFTFNVKFRF
ncbi:MAG TPA: SusC/RagA family TonB-linked outer membrane protein, partial [Fibrella sp.]